MSEDEVLVVLDAPLAVEVDVVELALVERLSDARGEVESRHLLVADFRVDPEQLGFLERRDERDRVPDGRQQDVAPRLVRLRLDREADVVALVGHVLREQVDALAIPLECRADVLCRVVLGALAAAPHDERLRSELGTEVELAERLAHCEPANRAVVRGESAVLEDRVR